MGVGIDRFLTQRTLAAMLVVCLALTIEEGIHLRRSHPNAGVFHSTEYHPGCQPLNAASTLLRCEVKGYGSIVFLCSKKGCWAKEPSTGLVITPAEQKRFDLFF